MTTRRAALAVLFSIALAGTHRPVSAQETRVPLSERVRGAEHIVVGVVVDVEPVLKENQFGDRLIVTHTTVEVEEVIKGPANVDTVVLEVEGGTLGSVTLQVSDLEPVEFGMRAVFMVSAGASGSNVPHLRGQGILRLDLQDQVVGEAWSVDDVRAAVRGRAGNRP